MIVQPYLFFDGHCEEAMNYYAEVLGAKIGCIMRFRDNPDFQGNNGGSGSAGDSGSGCGAPGDPDKVMHATFRIGETELMASDGNCGSSPSFQGFSLSYPVADAAEADRVFSRLAGDGTVQMPIGPTFFSPRFGMVADRFGVSWMIIVPGQQNA